MWTALLVTLLGGGLAWIAIHNTRQRLKGWQDAVESCGLRVAGPTPSFHPKVTARAGLVEVRIEAHGDKGRSTRIAVLAPGPPDFHEVTIRPESMFKLGREIEIGDADFDSSFFIQGPAQLVLALLDAEMRRLLAEVKDQGRLEISSGELQVVLTEDEKVPEVLPLLLEIRKRFAPPVAVWRCLAENANLDPKPGVRLQNLLLLVRELPGNEWTVETLRKACSDPAPEIRLRAARELGIEARGVLQELAEGFEDDVVSAEAISALDRELPAERTRAILENALKRRRLQTARACLEALGRSGPAAVDMLAKVLEREFGELAPAAAQALGETGSPAAEPPLILALQRDDESLRLAAAKALGRVGSVAAVLPLKEAADGFLLGEIRKVARQSIAEIQSRVQGASPGQLSLAGAEAGQLSLAQAEAGQLSLAIDPAGQLSLDEDQKARGKSGPRS